jgi:hypothetical protein
MLELSEFRDPDGHALEIFWELDKVDWDGEARPPRNERRNTPLKKLLTKPRTGHDTTLADPSLRRN